MFTTPVKLIPKRLLLLLCVICSVSTLAQSSNHEKEGLSFIESELKIFIDSTKLHGASHGKNNVYTVYVYNTLPDTNSFCFVISYIVNRSDYFYPDEPPYLLKFGEDIALLTMAKGYTTKWLRTKDLNKVDSLGLKIIKNKVTDNAVWIAGEAEKELFWYDGCSDRRRYCIRIGEASRYNVYGQINCSCSNYSIRNFASVKSFFTCKSEYPLLKIPPLPPVVK